MRYFWPRATPPQPVGVLRFGPTARGVTAPPGRVVCRALLSDGTYPTNRGPTTPMERMGAQPREPPGMVEQTVTIARAAELSGLTRKALQRRVERGELPATVESGRRRIPLAALYRAGLIEGEPPGEGSGVDAALTRAERLTAAAGEALAQLRAELAAERGQGGGKGPPAKRRKA
jgi:hypothetical protein